MSKPDLKCFLGYIFHLTTWLCFYHTTLVPQSARSKFVLFSFKTSLLTLVISSLEDWEVARVESCITFLSLLELHQSRAPGCSEDKSQRHRGEKRGKARGPGRRGASSFTVCFSSSSNSPPPLANYESGKSCLIFIDGIGQNVIKLFDQSPHPPIHHR
jgi:hypothetical protein